MKWALAAGLAVIRPGRCTTPVTQPQRSTTGSQLITRPKNCRAMVTTVRAAQTYETLAAQSSGELRDRLLLRAAREYVRADQTDKRTRCSSKSARRCRARISRCARRSSAELALRAQRPDRSAGGARSHSAATAARRRADILELRARALFALNRPAAGVSTALERERRCRQPGRCARQPAADLAGPAAKRRRQCRLHRAARRQRDAHRLARSRPRSARSPHAIRSPRTKISPQWRGRYPTHPANSLLNEEVLPGAGRRPRLSGADRGWFCRCRAGSSLRASQCATVFSPRCCSRMRTQRPDGEVYDSAEMGAATAYQPRDRRRRAVHRRAADEG